MKCKNTEIQTHIIQRIKELRILNNISQTRLSEILGVSSGQIGSIESPRFQHKYTLKQIYTFCTYIKFPFEKIFLTDKELNTDNYTHLLIQKIIEYDE